jgi:serine/threonine-protein kinase
VIDPNAFIGRRVDDVSSQLSAAGLLVRIKTVDAAGVAAGVVTGLDPSGPVPSGTTVTVDVSRGSPVTPTATTAAPDRGKGKGKPKH